MAGLNMDSVWVLCFLMQPIIAKLPVPQTCQTQQETAAWNLENSLLTLLRQFGREWKKMVGYCWKIAFASVRTATHFITNLIPWKTHRVSHKNPAHAFKCLHQKCVKSASAWKEHGSSNMRHSVHRKAAGVCFSSAHNLQNARLIRKKVAQSN